MSVTVFCNTKGGPGKTTLSTNVAVCLVNVGKKVTMLDADPQATAKAWLDRRNKFQPDAPRIQGYCVAGDVYNPALDAALVADEVVVDTAGASTGEVSTALLAADRIVIPFRPSIADLDAMVVVMKLLTETLAVRTALKNMPRLTAVVSMASPNPRVCEVAEAQDAMKEYPNIELLPVLVRERKEYRDCLKVGLGCIESNNLQAKAEMQALTVALFGDLWLSTSDR